MLHFAIVNKIKCLPLPIIIFSSFLLAQARPNIFSSTVCLEHRRYTTTGLSWPIL